MNPKKGRGSSSVRNEPAVREEPDFVIAEVATRSITGRSLFEGGIITARSVASFHSTPSVVAEAKRRLEELGFETVSGPMTTTIKGSRALFERVFDCKLKVESASVLGKNSKGEVTVFYYSPASQESRLFAPPPQLADVVDGVVLPVPHEFMQSPLPPAVGYYHLNVPADVSLLTNADRAHRLCVTGNCRHVAMVDSGHATHPFYTQRGYNVQPVVLSPDAAATNPLMDEVGHGSMESANVFATAPKVKLTPVKTRLIDATAAFVTAMQLGPDIITCSWGRSLPTPPFNVIPPEEVPLAAAIAEAVRRGIIVCFSSGNGHIGWPAMHPDVISVGGVHAEQDGSLRASDFASSFTTPIVPGRNVPDICGLVGLRPLGIYIMLPGQVGSAIDVNFAGGAFPNGDETAPNDGWACISGTSAACPQVAGVCALMREVEPNVQPVQARSILQATGRDITVGSTNPAANQPPGAHLAGPGPDLATGSGLVDAATAVIETASRFGRKVGCRCGCAKDDCRCGEEEPTMFRYSIKFVCGKSCGSILAKGEYWTAINVRNTSDKPVRFRKRFALALPGERAGHLSEFFTAALGPGEAFEIDCADIQRHTRMPDCCFLKGFAVVESPVELDIVAVYTASPRDGEVSTMDVEHVQPTKIRREPKEPPDDDVPDPKLPDLIPVPPFPPGPPAFPSNYCKSREELAIIVRNQGAGPAGPTTTRVTFYAIGQVVDTPTPPLGPGNDVLLTVPIPRGCFQQESCVFRIRVNAKPGDGVLESNMGNNDDSSGCVVVG